MLKVYVPKVCKGFRWLPYRLTLFENPGVYRWLWWNWYFGKLGNTRARCHGYDSSRVKSDHKLGSKTARAEANTFRTFAEVCTHADGSGCVSVIRDGQTLHHFAYGPDGGN